MANEKQYDMNAKDGRRMYIKNRYYEHVYTKNLPIVQLCLTQIFREGGMAEKDLQKFVKDFRREVVGHLHKEDSHYSDMRIFDKIGLLALFGIEAHPEMEEKVKTFVIFENKHPVTSNFPELSFVCYYDKMRHTKKGLPKAPRQKEDPRSKLNEDPNSCKSTKSMSMNMEKAKNKMVTDADDDIEKTAKSMEKKKKVLVGGDDENEKKAKSKSKKANKLSLTAVPSIATFFSNGGYSKHELVSSSNFRIGFKTTCSDNSLYHVKPAQGFVESRRSIEIKIKRSAGPSKDERVGVLYGFVEDDEKDPLAFLKTNGERGRTYVLLAMIDDASDVHVPKKAAENVADVKPLATEEDVRDITFEHSLEGKGVGHHKTRSMQSTQKGEEKAKKHKQLDQKEKIHPMESVKTLPSVINPEMSVPNESVVKAPSEVRSATTRDPIKLLRAMKNLFTELDMDYSKIAEKREYCSQHLSEEVYLGLVKIVKEAIMMTVFNSSDTMISSRKKVEDVDEAQKTFWREIGEVALVIPSAKSKKWIRVDGLTMTINGTLHFF